MNFDTGKAWWLSGDAETDARTSRYIPDGSPGVDVEELTGENGKITCLRAPAPMPPFTKTVLKVLEDRTENGRRRLKLFVDSPRDAQIIHLRLKTEASIYSATVLVMAMDGKQWKSDWNLKLETIPFEGGRNNA